MAHFDIIGSYRFVYSVADDEDVSCMVCAVSDADALMLAKGSQRGFALQVWTGRRLIESFGKPKHALSRPISAAPF